MDRAAKRDWLVRGAALAIFVLGFVAGGLAFNVYRSGHESGAPSRERFDQMLDRLNLDDGQRAKVKAIFDDTHSQMEELRKECGPKFKAVRERTDARLREVMTPEQWQRFQDMTSEGRDRRHRDHGPDR